MARKANKNKQEELAGFYRVNIPPNSPDEKLFCIPAMNTSHVCMELTHNEIIHVDSVQSRDSDGEPQTYLVKNSYGEEVYLSAAAHVYLEKVNITTKRRKI